METTGVVRFDRVDFVADCERGLVAHLHGEQLLIEFVSDEMVRFKMSRDGTFDEAPSHAVCVDPLRKPVQFNIEHDHDKVQLDTAAIAVTLWLEPFRLDVHRLDGSPVVESAPDDDGGYATYAATPQGFVIRRRCGLDDAIYGLGEKTGRQNRRGRGFTLWNTDVLNEHSTAEFTQGLVANDPRADSRSTEFDPYYVSIPFFYHQAAHTGSMAASFIDNPRRATYGFGSPDQYRVEFFGGQYTEYVFAGPNMPDILRSYSWLTGRMQIPPLWALGYHQSRWYRYTQETFEALGARHRELGIPCDALWLDIDYMDGYRVFTWDTDSFPDPPTMLKRLSDKGFRVITIIDPGIKYEPGYPIFDDAVARDVLAKTKNGEIYVGEAWPDATAFPDFAAGEARTWWGALNAAHVRLGLAGIWNDMNEPSTGEVSPYGMFFERGRTEHARYHNEYALLMAMGTANGLLTAMPELRTFILTRAGSSGIQRYAAHWLGDNQASWEHLWLSMPMAAGFGLSGQPFVGADIGGFQGAPSPELFVRWLQYGALTPFCRNHCADTSPDRYAWSFGADIEQLAREAVELRYRLMPYLYASFVRATESGEPVQRPLVFDYQYDEAVREIDDEYMLGPQILVAPVYREGQTERDVYLPAGTWYDWETDRRIEGGRVITTATPLTHIPKFVRGGAVIPMWIDAPESTSGHHPNVIELHFFVPADDEVHNSLLQEDDGLTFAALTGARVRTAVEATNVAGRVRLEAQVDGAGYPEFARTEFRLVIHGAEPPFVRYDQRDIARTGNFFSLPNQGVDFTVSFDC